MIWDIDMTCTNGKDDIIVYLCNNKDHIKDLVKDSRQWYEEQLIKHDILFHDDIKESYKSLLIQTISDEVCKRLAVPYEMVIEVIEDINILELMNDNN